MVSPIRINASEQVSGTPVGSGTTIGNPVSGGNSGAVLFVDNNGNLAQSPSKFVLGTTNTQLALGTNSPLAQLHVKQPTRSSNPIIGVIVEGSTNNPVTVSGHTSGAQTDLAYYAGVGNIPASATSEYIRFRGDKQSLNGGASGTVNYGIEIHDDYPAGGVTGLTSVHYLSVGSTGVGVDSRTGFANLSVGGNVAIGYDYTYADWVTANSYIPPTNGLIVEGSVGIATTSPGAWLDVAGNVTTNGLTLRSGTAIQFNDSGSHNLTLQAAAALSANATIKLTGDGTLGQFLKTDGAGNWSFSNAGGSSSVGGAVAGGQSGSVLFIDGSGNLNQDNPNFYFSNTLHKLAVGMTTSILATGRITSLVGATGNMEGLFVSQSDTTGNSNAVRIVTMGGGNSLSISHQANTAITDSAGAVTLDNTANTGIGVNVYSNQALPNSMGALIRAHAANTGFSAAPVYVRNDGTATGTPTLRLDAYSPLVYFGELNQIAPAGLYAVDGKNDFLRITGRRADNSAFDPFVVFQRLDQGGSNLGGSVGIRTGVNSGNSTLQVNGSFAVGVNSVSVPYSAGNTDEYITVNASAFPNGLTVSLPQAAGVPGRIVHVIKNDSTGNFVGIAPFSGDTVYRRPAKQLFAKNQVASLISDGVTNWNPYGVIAYTPHYVGNAIDTGYTGNVGSANSAVLVAFENRSPVTMNGVRLKVTSSSGNVDVGVYDSNGNRLGSSGSTVCPATGKSTINFITPASLYTPGVHYLALAADNISAAFSLSGADALLGVYSFPTSFPLPTSFSMTGLTATNLPFALAGVVAGGLGL